jgi:hypothetical protein
MARAISVKVSTAKVIKALEDKLEAGKNAIGNNENKRKAHTLALTEHYNSIMATYGDKLVIENVSQRWNGQIEVSYKVNKDIEIPNAPQLELEQELGRYEVQEIENAIRILKMTDEEVVNASTFKSIAQYL